MGRLLKGLIFNDEVALSVLDTTDIVNQAIKFHKLSPLSAAGLGRTLTATAFMCSNLKNDKEKLSITIKGNGVGGQIVCVGDGKLSVRGYIVNPNAELPLKQNGKLDVGGLVGKNGTITVIKDLGLKEPYVGRSNLISGEIAEDFAAYFAYSEQQPTAISLGVLIGKDGLCLGAGGVVMQPLPNCSEENISKIEEMIPNFKDISSKIFEYSLDKLVSLYFPECDFTEFNPKYKCNCSNSYIEKILITLGEKELYETVEKEGKIEVCCEFCDKKYVYLKDDVDRLLKK